jgi:hypothetical protein
MNSRGICCSVYGGMSWDNLVGPIHQLKFANPDARIIIGGYSLGAMRACDLCNILARPEHQTVVDLLITLVPPPRTISWNVRRALNHTVKGGAWWSDYLSAANPNEQDRITNVNHFSVLSITHYTIQALPSVHSSIHKAIEEVVNGTVA